MTATEFTMRPWLPGLILWGMLTTALNAPASDPSAPSNAAMNGPLRASKFCFGTPTSVTRTGFAKVTVKDVFTPEKGYGFRSAGGLRAFDRGGSKIELPKDPYTASVYGEYRTTSDITCGLIEGDSDNAFLVALPDGDYTIWVIASDAEWDSPLFQVWANGQKKLDVRIPRARFVFMELFQARAAEGQLRIELKGRNGWILSGLVIGKKGPELADVVAKLERDIFFLTDQELPKWKETKYIPVNPPLEFTPEEGTGAAWCFPRITRSRLCRRTFRHGRRLESR